MYGHFPILDKYRREKHPYYWDLDALPIECSKNAKRTGDEIVSEAPFGQGKQLILLLGPPASGKTTFCRRIQVKPPNGLMPIDISAALPCTPEEVLKSLANTWDLEGESIVENIENEGNILFIADGIGESHNAARVIESITNLTMRFNHSNFLMTCRTGDWPKDEKWLPHFEKWFIVDLTPSAWQRFLEKQDAELQKRITRALAEQPKLRELCKNQFLFLIAVTVFTKEGNAFSQLSRAKLFDLFLQQLLGEWEKLTPTAHAATVGFLEELAVEMRRSGERRSWLAHGRAFEVLRHWLQPGISQKVLEQEMAHQYHLGLIEESNGGIRLFQENFQEYLCAKWLTARFPDFPVDAEIWSLCEEILESLKGCP